VSVWSFIDFLFHIKLLEKWPRNGKTLYIGRLSRSRLPRARTTNARAGLRGSAEAQPNRIGFVRLLIQLDSPPL
jgi:hypothetical protein